ncbi:MAG: CopD family protein [Thermoplasmata archaeon]|nr:CopD family protein [Thermoplasmata archaeon]
MILWESVVLGVHILGACIWVGGTFALGVVAAALGRSGPPGDARVAEQTVSVARALGWVMWPALGITIVTGGLNLSWWLPPGDWMATPQGHWLMAKLVVVGLVLVTAGSHSFLVGPRIRRLRGTGATTAELRGLRRWSAALGAVSAVSSAAVVFLAVAVGSF